ncbi:MAG: response regulator transcription factor, partial [Glaciecola sp.]|nr:response regulator transcription factor [Glaciecola sp.]
KILIVDDDSFQRPVVTKVLNLLGVIQVASVADCHAAELRLGEGWELLILDLNMPGSDNYYGLTSVIDKAANTPIIVVTASDNEESVNIAMHLGARGYIPKTFNSRKMAHAIMTVLDGGKFIPEKYIDKIGVNAPDLMTSIEHVKGLTPKQLRVLRCLKEGKMNKQIAEELFVTEATVKAHISAIFKKFNVSSRTQVVLLVDKIDLAD